LTEKPLRVFLDWRYHGENGLVPHSLLDSINIFGIPAFTIEGWQQP
jgi:hypothetical protein